VRGIVEPGRPPRRVAGKLPFDHVAKGFAAMMSGHEETLAIEMVAGRPGMVAVWAAGGHGVDIERMAGDSNRIGVKIRRRIAAGLRQLPGQPRIYS
jgi:hypothetical protein